MPNVLFLKTNDPENAEFKFTAIVERVKSGIIALPSVVALGTLAQDTSARRSIVLCDDAVEPRSVDRVSVRGTSRVSAKLLPADRASPQQLDAAKGKKVLGTVEIAFDASDGGPVDDEILVHLSGEGQPPLKVPLVGRVVADIEVSQTTMVLPRRAGGALAYSGECWCHRTDGGVLDLRVVTAPRGYEATIRPIEGEPWRKKVVVRRDPAKELTGLEPSQLVLRGNVKGKERDVRVRLQH